MTTTPRSAPPTDGRARGAALASVVLAVAGALVAFVPRLHVLALVLAVLGLLVAAAALRRARTSRAARAGLVLSAGAVAAVVAVTVEARGDVVQQAQEPPGGTAGPVAGGAAGTRPSGSPEGVEVLSCGEAGASGTATATVSVTGTAERTRSLSVAVEWVDAADATLGEGRTDVAGLAPGQTVTVAVRGSGVTGAVACRVLEVTQDVSAAG
ncbi:FxLYD domain-containing protein [Kineococcus esterisolvens]|uniref:FxLYD domain-containing protein n=1 Tax=unclassified Kineococcus TaxID=2621656 RepID=UPI003D7EA97C